MKDVSTAPGASNPTGRPDVPALFRSLAAMGKAMAGLGRQDRHLDADTFEDLTDHLLIVQPETHFGRFRFEFCGSVIADQSKVGDVTGASFGELMADATIRPVLAGYRHVETLKTSHVTRDQQTAGGRHALYTRLILPLFLKDRVALMLSTVVYHDEPLNPGGAGGAARP